MQIAENVCLKPYTTIGCGGKARFFTEVHQKEQMQAAFEFCSKEKLSFFMLGKGSNTIFDDQGFSGLVILNKMQKIAWDDQIVTVDSGYAFSHLGVVAAKKNLSGLEFAAGIPASVGGAIYMNAGASGQQTQDCLRKVVFMHSTGQIEEFSQPACRFGYRQSIFQRLQGCILSAQFCLTACDQARMRQLEIISYRTKSQPYGDKSAGCFFKNPKEKPAGALIEEAGLKGFAIGGAKVSLLHGNFIINDKDATSQDLFDLAAHVQQQVFEKKGIQLELEVRKISCEEG